MSEEGAGDTAVIIAVIVGLLAFFALLWGLFIYNNAQNIKRDEYVVSHCQKVGAITNGYGGTNYKCGNEN